MMKTVGKAFGHVLDPRASEHSKQLVDNDTFVGLEIELENIPYFTYPLSDELHNTGYWSVEDDGSLRNSGLEFKMGYNGAPLRGMDVIRALREFKKYIFKLNEKHNIVPNTSERTSIHLHIDVRDLTDTQLKHFMFLYIMFEEAFFNMFKEHRRTNNYCRSVKDHYDYLLRLSNFLGDKQDIVDFVERGYKYDAMNFKSIGIFGSLEFRLMEGSFDTKKILKWMNILLRLKKFAVENDIVFSEYPEQISLRGLGPFLNLVFEEDAEFIRSHTNEVSLLKQLRLAQKCMRLVAEQYIPQTYPSFLEYEEGSFPVFDKFISNLSEK